MKILHVNTFDTGGAAIACIRIHTKLLKEGVDSNLLLRFKTKNIPNAKMLIPQNRFRLFKKLKNKLSNYFPSEWETRKRKFINSRSKGLEYFSFIDSKIDITDTLDYKEADIIHLHWVADFIDWKSFFIKNKKPVVWTLHDQNPSLGLEHYQERFLGISDMGFPLKREYSNLELEMQNILINKKIRVLKKVEKLYIIPNSFWIQESSEKSLVFKNYYHQKIDYIYPVETFMQRNINFSRHLLNIPPSKKIILFGAASIDNNRKGFIYLVKALEKLAKNDQLFFQNVSLYCFGSNSGEKNLSFPVSYLGEISDERILSCIYSASDFFIMPSLEEALGMVAVESLLCGCPVIAFSTGGIRETIEHEVNGLLCEEISVSSLGNNILKVLEGKIKFNREKISKDAHVKYNPQKSISLYKELYNRINNNQI